MNTTSPKSSLAKLGLHSKNKSIKVMVLGQSGVGKTALELVAPVSVVAGAGGDGGDVHVEVAAEAGAVNLAVHNRGWKRLCFCAVAMVVRFITRRFIGEYDPNLEKIYTYTTMVDNEMVQFDILDAAGQPNETEFVRLESNIRWADAFILMYSVTDKCSFDECNRLKFLINYNKRRRKLGSTAKDGISDVPVILVGNKTDQWGDRMVSIEEGQRRFREISCVCFHEISVRESVDQVQSVFRDVCRFWRVLSKFPKLKRSTSDVQNATEMVLSPDSGVSFYQTSCTESDSRRSFFIADNTCLEERGDHNEFGDEMGSSSLCSSRGEIETPFRGRASTDGTLLSRPRRWRYPPPGCDLPHSNRVERRMSISARGSNASY